LKVKKAVITAAGKDQQNLPLQTLIDRDGTEKSVLQIIVEEALRGGVEEICVVVQPGDQSAYKDVVGDHGRRLNFVEQKESLGYGHAIYCSRDFIQQDPFLHLVGDHLYISLNNKGCAQHLIEIAEAESSAVSAVHATRENLLSHFGTIGGQHIQGNKDIFKVETVVEKPTPTFAEQKLIIPGLRAGYYLCFFGMHVLTPTIFDILEQNLKEADKSSKVSLSMALNTLAKHEQYLALNKADLRYDIGVKYGLLSAQIALSLNGIDKDEVLSKLLELLYMREIGSGSRGE